MKCKRCGRAEMIPLGDGVLDQCELTYLMATRERCPKCEAEDTNPVKGERWRAYPAASKGAGNEG